MEYFQLTILALIQGLTEFLPISSSAHLILPAQLLGWTDQGLAFDVAVHVGSLMAVGIYFRRDVQALLGAWANSLRGHSTEESRLAWLVIWATVPAALSGLIFHDFIETQLRSVVVIAVATIGFGILLGLADVTGKRKLQISDINLYRALGVGVAQALALIPGTSRSGITITAALFLGLDRQAAARFSFLLSMPLIALSGGYKAVGLIGSETVVLEQMMLGVVVSAVCAGTCIHLFLKWIDRIGMWPFVVYRILLGMVLFWMVYG